ncbi:hypothetical protein [Geodermatophilus sp. SYSU D00696]
MSLEPPVPSHRGVWHPRDAGPAVAAADAEVAALLRRLAGAVDGTGRLTAVVFTPRAEPGRRVAGTRLLARRARRAGRRVVR